MAFMEFLKFPARSAFPATGDDHRLYVDLNSGKLYYWDHGTYHIASGDLSDIDPEFIASIQETFEVFNNLVEEGADKVLLTGEEGLITTINRVNLITPGDINAYTKGEVNNLVNLDVHYNTTFEASEGFTASTVYTGTVIGGFEPYQMELFKGAWTTTGATQGVQSAQMRWYTSAPDIMGTLSTLFPSPFCSEVEFLGSSSAASNMNLQTQYSFNGTDWVNVGPLLPMTTTPTEYLVAVGLENVYIRLTMVLTGSVANASKITIDQFTIYASNINNILKFDNFASLPIQGNETVLYITLDDNRLYHWNDIKYVQVNDVVLPITWTSLKNLKDAGGLTPGQQYRITDYECTTVQDDTQSAGHQFDIIVVADDVSTLNENARACLHEGDTYFANSKLEAWKLKYCLDNDTTRFEWADDTDGKGVIYQMIDEFDNNCPYDFKNIMFKRKLTEGVYDPDDGTETWVYTFTGISFENLLLVDGTTLKADEYFTDEGSNLYKNNTIGIREIKSCNEDGYDNIIQALSANVFIGRYNEEPSYEQGPAKIVLFSFNNTLGSDCYSNTFGNYCYSNTFRNYCYSNTFGNLCFNNTFGSNCYYNTFGDACYYNTFGSEYASNTFGDACYYNTFGFSCYHNTFGNSCYYNTFGSNCPSNTFGNYCYGNTFGNACSSNTFGNYCYGNTFGNYCYSNTFGDYCSSNTFGNRCRFLRITNNSSEKRYIHVENGTAGASSLNFLELYTSDILSKDYQVTFKRSVSGKFLMLWSNDTGALIGNVAAVAAGAATSWTTIGE